MILTCISVIASVIVANVCARGARRKPVPAWAHAVSDLLFYRELNDQCVQIWSQSVSDWAQMGRIREFFLSDFSTFWLYEPKCTEI